MSCSHSSGDASAGWGGVGAAGGMEQAGNALPRPGPKLRRLDQQAPRTSRPSARLPLLRVSPPSRTWVSESIQGFLGTFPKLWGLRDQNNFQRKLGGLIG